MPTKSHIGKAASEETREAFAERISSYTILTAKEVERLFPEESDRTDLDKLIEILNSHRAEDAKREFLIDNIDRVASPIFQLLKKKIF